MFTVCSCNLPSKRKQKNKQTNKSQWKLLCVMVCHTVNPFVQQLHLQMLHAMSHWTGSRPLPSDTLSILDPHPESSQIACRCPVCGSAGLATSRAPTVHGWGRCWVGPTQSPECRFGWELKLVSPPTPSQPEPALLICPGEGRGQFYLWQLARGRTGSLELSCFTFRRVVLSGSRAVI